MLINITVILVLYINQMGCCELNINSILVNKSKFPKLLSKYKWSILLSGKGVNEFGLYTKC